MSDRKMLTVSSTNMTGYVGVAEKMPLDRLGEYMNKYLAVNTDAITALGGAIDKVVGDRIIAFWDQFDSAEEGAQCACESALKQLSAMREFYAWAKAEGFPCPQIRIGIHAGPALVGNFGSESRVNYTAIGQAVSVATFLEAKAKEVDPPILVSHTVKELTKSLSFGAETLLQSEGQQFPAYPLRGKGTQ
jgi:adenylate cyclase